MTATVPSRAPASPRHRPKTLTVFAAAFIAGAAVAVGVNRALDVHLAQSKPQVECEPIFVALRSLPQGSPVTVWDVALRDWPKAMVPSTALKSHDTFEGHLLRHPLREGQPLLSVQLIRSAAAATTTVADPTVIEQPFAAPAPATVTRDVASTTDTTNDSWLPGPATGAIAATERPIANTPTRNAPTRLAAEPQSQAAQPATPEVTPTEVTPAEPPTVVPRPADVPVAEAPKPVDTVTAALQPQLLPAVEPQAISQPQPVSRTDVPDATVPAAPPSPELVPYSTAQSPTTPETRTPAQTPTPSAPSTPISATNPADTTDSEPQRPDPTSAPAATGPTPANEPTPADEPTPATEPTAAAAVTTPTASTPGPVEPPVDAAVTRSVEPELKTVLAQNPTAAPQPDAPTPPQPRESPNRYLVVPERIALQADVSFVNPAPRETVVDEPSPAGQQPPQQSATSTPQARQQPQQKSAQAPKATGRPQGRTGQTGRSPAAQRPTDGSPRQSGATQPPAGKRPTTAATPEAGAMFPNIAAGIDVLTGGFKRARGEQSNTPPR